MVFLEGLTFAFFSFTLKELHNTGAGHKIVISLAVKNVTLLVIINLALESTSNGATTLFCKLTFKVTRYNPALM
jgi:hypothetical protein